MKKIVPIIFSIILVFSGCTSQKDMNSSCLESAPISASNTLTENYDSSVDNSASTNNTSAEESSSSKNTPNSSGSSSVDNTPSTGNTSIEESSSSESIPNSIIDSSNDESLLPGVIPSSSDTNANNLGQPGNPNTETPVKNQVHLYSYVYDRGLVIQKTFDYSEGDTWAELLKTTTEISVDTALDVNFNTVEYLKYNDRAIMLNSAPVKRDDVISNKNIYKLETLAGPPKVRNTTMYDLINVEHASEGRNERTWYIRKYVINETSKTTGTITTSWIEVREYSKPDEEFNGTIVVKDPTTVTHTYTSEYGLYMGKTIELDDGSKILFGNDLYWFYLGNSNNKRVLCEDYRAYKSVPNNPNDSFWSFYWSMFN